MKEFFEAYLTPTKTIYTMWVIMLVILIVSFIATRKMKDVPGKLQNLAEMAVAGLLNMFAGIMGEAKARKYYTILASFFILIVVCNYTGLIPGSGEAFTVPTSVLAVTSALAVIAFFAIQTSGIKAHGVLGYLKTFFKPVFFLFPILILEQFTRPLSMALRLYGNISGEETAAEQLFELVPLIVPLVMHILSLLFSFIQAMVFTMLLAVFINEATEEDEEAPEKLEAHEASKNAPAKA